MSSRWLAINIELYTLDAVSISIFAMKFNSVHVISRSAFHILHARSCFNPLLFPETMLVPLLTFSQSKLYFLIDGVHFKPYTSMFGGHCINPFDSVASFVQTLEWIRNFSCWYQTVTNRFRAQEPHSLSMPRRGEFWNGIPNRFWEDSHCVSSWNPIVVSYGT